MKLSPFWRGAYERAGKSLSGGVVSFLFTLGVEHLVALDPFEQAGAYAVGVTVWSVICSLASKPFGPKGSPSLVQECADPR